MSRPGSGPQEPSPHFLEALADLERSWPSALAGRALDLACGRGRHALTLARRGVPVTALDRDEEALAALAAAARAERLAIETIAIDLEAPGARIPGGPYTLVVVVNYLWRPLVPEIRSALAPGGALYYETFTIDQARYGRPASPQFLLRPGELATLFPDLDIRRGEEGVFPGPAAKALLLAVRSDEEPTRAAQN